MERTVIVTVASRARGADGALEWERSTARGILEELPGGWRVRYAPPEEEGALTSLELLPDCLIWTRGGAVRSSLRFAPGELCASVCETPWGSFPMEARTELLLASLDGTGGTVELRYTLALGGAADSRELSILVETEEETA